MVKKTLSDLAMGVRTGVEAPDVLGAIEGLERSPADFSGWGTVERHTFGCGRLNGLSARLTHDQLDRQHQIGPLGQSARSTSTSLVSSTCGATWP